MHYKTISVESGPCDFFTTGDWWYNIGKSEITSLLNPESDPKNQLNEIYEIKPAISQTDNNHIHRTTS